MLTMLISSLSVSSVIVLAVYVTLVNSLRTQPRFTISNHKSSITLLYQNNLNASDDNNHVGFLLLDAMPYGKASQSCSGLGETLLSYSQIQNQTSDFLDSLRYLSFAGYIRENQSFHINNGQLQTLDHSKLNYSVSASCASSLPVLCTQSQHANAPSNAMASSSNKINLVAGSNMYMGYRNQKSFRFLGIPYADRPGRFTYSQVYTGNNHLINATAYGSQCLQAGGGSEDCLFLNIQTPYIPKQGSLSHLRPVLFWIHGGGFTGGSGADPLSDGGNLCSSQDVVVVTINYRLSTFGFLAIPETDLRGNYGIGDQIVALQWTIANIASFGGDPNQITIMGESAGAGSVRTLLGSPEAITLFQGAVAMSNLGGGQDLGLTSNYGTTYSSYLTIDESFNLAGSQILKSIGCQTNSTIPLIQCLQTANATVLVSLSTVARYVVQDGNIVNTPELVFTSKNGSSAYVPVIFGTTANDGASFSTYPSIPIDNQTQGLMLGLSITESYAESIISSGLFPLYDSGNFTLDVFNVTQRIATDNTFLCIDQATVYQGAVTETFPSAYFYQIDRTINGYNPENVPGNGPSTLEYPFGDPNLPYFKLHGSDMAWMFGNFYTPLRDANDLYSIQLVSSYFAEFVKSGQPNPSVEYLAARGYDEVLQAVQETGPWEKIESQTGPIKHLDYPSVTGTFVDLEQCAWLNYSINYYAVGH